MTKVLATIALGAATLALVAPSAAAQSPSDREIAKAGLFVADDFPAGWKVTTPKKSTDQTKCANVKKNVTGKASSKQFEHGSGISSMEVYLSAVGVYKNEARARDAYRRLSSSKVQRCLRDKYKKSVEEDVSDEVDKVDVQLGTVTGPGFGDDSTHIELKATFSEGLTLDVFLNVVLVRSGRAVGYYARSAGSELKTPSEFDEDAVDFNQLVTNAVDRLAVEQGGQPSGSGTGEAARPRSEVRVVVFNAGSASGAAGNMTNTLRSLGYQLAPVSNTTPRMGTAVQCKEGFDDEATRLQGDVGPGTTVEPFASPPLPETETVNCVVLVGL